MFAGAAWAAGAEAAAGAEGATRFAGAAGFGAADVDAGRAVLTGGADGAVLPAPPPEPLPGRNANMRSKVMAKPVCSSGASDKSGRLVMVI